MEFEHKPVAVYGSPGQAARLAGVLQALWPLLVILFAGGYLLGLAAPLPGLPGSGAGGLLLVLALFTGWLIPRSERRFGNYLKGARGEEAVARRLDALPPGHHVFHGVNAEGAQIDHVVAGPGGLFAIETKNWSGAVRLENGRVLVEGRVPDRPPLEQARLGAERLGGCLAAGDRPAPVRPVLCFVSDGALESRHRVGEVEICTTGTLLDVIAEAPPAWSEDALAEAVEGLKARVEDA